MLQIYSMKPLSEFFSRTQQNASIGPPSTNDKSNRKIVSTNRKKTLTTTFLLCEKWLAMTFIGLKVSEKPTTILDVCVHWLKRERARNQQREIGFFYFFFYLFFILTSKRIKTTHKQHSLILSYQIPNNVTYATFYK